MFAIRFRPNRSDAVLAALLLTGLASARVPAQELGVQRIFDSADVGPGGEPWVETRTPAAAPAETTVRVADGREIRTVVDDAPLRRTPRAFGVQAPGFFTCTTPAGVDLKGWRLTPEGFDADDGRRWPVLMYVHGGPGSQTVTDARGGSRVLWHRLPAREGYVMGSVDHRGIGAGGSAFESRTYLRPGRLETESQIPAANRVAEEPWADGDRIGIRGWSYGGCMTLVSLVEGGERFAAGEQFEFVVYPDGTHAIGGRDTPLHLWSMRLDSWRERMPRGGR